MDGSGSITPQPSEETSGRSDYPDYDVFGLQQMARVLRRRRLIVIGVCALATLAGAVYALLQPAVYESSALLMLRPNEPSAAGEQQRTNQAPDNGYLESQLEILRSSGLARQLVDRQHLADDPAWGSGSGERRRTSATRSVLNAIDVSRRPGAYVVEVTARSHDPRQAARLANDLVNIYYASREQARIEYASQTSTWLSGRLAELRGEVQQRESEVEHYRAAHGLTTVDGDMIAETQLRDAETSVVSARADLAERQARNRQVRAMLQQGRSAESLAGALSSETMIQLRARQADVARQLAEYSERYEDRHPAVLNARAERDDIDRQIRAEVSRLAQNLDDEAEISGARVRTLESHLAGVRGRLEGNNAEQVHLRELERNAQAARAVYENFLLRYHEVSDGAGGLGGDAQIIANAVPSDAPVSRSPGQIVLLAAALGLLAGALAAFLAEQFTTTLQSADDVEQKIGLPILTSIPLLPPSKLRLLAPTEQHPAGFVVANPMSAFAESMRMLRARISHANLSGSVKVVAITSALAGEGKSSTALSLARVAALSGRKVILVDCDLRRRSLNHMLCIEPRVGVAQVLNGEAAWRDATGRDELSGAHILPAATSDEFASQDLFDTEAMRHLVRELSQTHDMVLLDCPPVLTLAEVRDLSTIADGVVVVTRRNVTQVLALQTAVNELRAVGAKIMGVAFNGVDTRAPGSVSFADPLYFSHAEKNRYLERA